MTKRLNDATPEEWDSLAHLVARKATLFADGDFKNEKGEDTYEEYLAVSNQIDDLREQRMDVIGQNGNDGLHYDSALDKQPGGDHYQKRAIQPIEYIIKNGMNFLEGNVIKYVTRYKDKGGKQDLEKAIHYLELLLESYDG